MRIAVEGCTHGELEQTYHTIQQIEQQDGRKIDLLLCCGDFQSTRNLSDLACMACPDKYKEMCSFYKYYSGEAIAPILTVFIGGNHEATNYLQELAYGGWVAPNIYYLGYAGVIQAGGVRIGGLSGIFKGFDYLHGHHEKPPYDQSTMRSAYHIRNVDVFRLKQLASNPPDVLMSHDWPRGVTKHGDTARLLRYKKHFREEVEEDRLGSGPTRELLDTVKPPYWFSAHLHCKFAALVPHEGGGETKFLALDKCLPRRQFLQVLEVGEEVAAEEDVVLRYDPEWLAVLRSTNHLLSVEKKPRYTPGPGSTERWDFTPTPEELAEVERRLGGDLDIPYNFEQTALAFRPSGGGKPSLRGVPQPQATTNKQTTSLCAKLGIYDPMALLLGTARPSMGGLTLASYSQEDHATLAQAGARLKALHPTTPVSKPKKREEGEEEEEKVKSEEKKPKLAIPAPKEEASSNDFLAVLDTIGKGDTKEEKEVVVEANDLFMIDKTGDNEAEKEEVKDAAAEVTPVRQLKRRNAAVYSTPD